MSLPFLDKLSPCIIREPLVLLHRIKIALG